MDLRNSLAGRIAVGKIIGFGIGGVGFVLLPYCFAGADLWLRFGFWAWYITFGALIGLAGVMTYHPVLKFHMPFWFRGLALGAWMNLVLVLLMYPQLVDLMKWLVVGGISFENPFWLVLEGALIGLLIDWVATKYGGEGAKIA